ncbi:piggyBac transposable element-derived protein 4 [Nephila pilipes]|uniref:PiggyBac transposable element-derived protein 4 n=1 Tax=Nephila pilipes TaxID=299642 RepID=A0A8X6M7Q4_NEPPI|nr:piggyBac transposable element-derived protein 4 [Nephila pilipes]
MSIKRFLWILTHLHLNDISLQPRRDEENFDKLFKVYPLLSHLSERHESIFRPGKCQAINESMIKFKGRTSLKQYMLKKLIKRGYKVWMSCDESGFRFQFKIYTGKVKDVENKLSERVVTYEKNHLLYMDNFLLRLTIYSDF